MKDEIKKILEEWKQFLSWCYENNDKTVEIHRDKLKYIIDYITNLQKTNKNHSKKLIELGDKITNLQEENIKLNIKLEDKAYEQLKVSYKKLQEENKMYAQLKDEYEDIIDKAIEYINQNKHLSMFADCREPEEDWNYDLEINPRELLNILQGEDNE